MNQHAKKQVPTPTSNSITADSVLDARTEKIIRFAAWSILHRSSLFQPYEKDDIEQELRIYLLRQMPKFNPKLSSRYTYATMICDRKTQNMLKLRARSLAKGPCTFSLEEAVDKQGQTLGDRISDEDYRINSGCQNMTDDQQHALQEKVAAVLSQLPKDDRFICEQIMAGNSLRGIAKGLNRPCSTLIDRFNHYIKPAVTRLLGAEQ